jgi:transposase InsO family protein
MEQLYALLNISRQNLSQWQGRAKSRDLILSSVKRIVIKHRTRHRKEGSRAIFYNKKIKEVLGIGINTFENMVKELGLNIKKTRSWIKTSDRCSKSKEYTNLINGLILTGPNQLIVGDLTYVLSPERYYIFALKDVYTSYLVGLAGSKNMTTEIAIEALDQLFELRGPGPFPDLIHHTDGGSQYFARVYIMILDNNEIKISVANTCLENGYAEQLHDIIKNYYLRFWDIGNESAFKRSLKEIKEIYNNERGQECLGRRTPAEYEKYIMSLDKDQRPQKKLHDFRNYKKGF